MFGYEDGPVNRASGSPDCGRRNAPLSVVSTWEYYVGHEAVVIRKIKLDTEEIVIDDRALASIGSLHQVDDVFKELFIRREICCVRERSPIPIRIVGIIEQARALCCRRERWLRQCLMNGFQNLHVAVCHHIKSPAMGQHGYAPLNQSHALVERRLEHRPAAPRGDVKTDNYAGSVGRLAVKRRK